MKQLWHRFKCWLSGRNPKSVGYARKMIRSVAERSIAERSIAEQSEA